MRTAGSLSLIVLAASLALHGCSSDSDGDIVSAELGQLAIEIHDHPAPQIAECWITIAGVQARQRHGQWMAVSGAFPHHFDLMQLQGGKTRQLATETVPAGDYDAIRLHLTGARLVMTDGETVDVPLPGGEHWIDVPMGRRCEVVGGSGAHVSVDFRVHTSFQHHADESWTCTPDIVVDGVWQHGQPGHHD
jgi:hypothetical protein